MSKMTEGPWESKHSINRAAYRIEAHPHAPGHTKLVAATLEDLPEDTANARGIAALPELKGAAEWVLAIGEGYHLTSEWDAAMNALRSALAKAKGGET